ncbi:Predicted ATPase [Pseudonocardia ammonioxydans]|uniref:Predicted ATPase n=1 Tax=Pseudonocardia ammonioxydans TaxID=260086 RepID=A0A1I4VMW8_PSUAM|nr:BTAD domain-containing putative transcriptional regulator [Pseudonocardia ammonioxydans]SFN02631.1 Predicted ATPase [Pseudonocardia ammonioxydans]
MRFGVLGPLEVLADDGTPVRVPELKVRALLAVLLVHGGTPVSADRLVEDLWGERLPANPTGALQARVSQLRRVLGDAEPGGRDLVASRAPGYLLHVPAEGLDTHRFQALVERAHAGADPRTRAERFTDALNLWRGPAYADFGDQEFARPAISRLEELRLSTLEDRAEARLELGEHRTLAGELDELVARHPLRERLRAMHLRALYRAGRQHEALDSYHELRERLRDELGVDPAPELAALYHAVLDHDPALAPATRGPAPAAAPAPGLPVPLTELIGRSDAVARVRDLTAAGRLVTLVGLGGVGKTRLALAAAHESAAGFADGVRLVELAGLPGAADTAALAEFVVAGLDIREDRWSSPSTRAPGPERRLADALRPQQLLLVLDNAEHVAGAVAELAARLLAVAPGLHLLVTSREPLAVPGETLWTVPPLALPDPAEHEPEALLRSAAVALFVARARATDAAFALTTANAAAVTSICRRLDGIPLALELAAARTRALGTAELAARLDDRFALLGGGGTAGGRRGTPTRQQTLRATLDWSWDLLGDTERAVLRRLSVHAEGCGLDAAEQVCAGDGVDGADVLDAVSRLVDRSLLHTVDGPDGLRYRMFESIAAYATERLHEAGEAHRTAGHHAAYYLALAERAAPRLREREQRPWLARLDAETPNLRAALDRSVAAGDGETALRLVDALAWYWYLRGRIGEGRRAAAAALSAGHDHPAWLRAPVATWAAGLALVARDEPADDGAAALALYDDSGDADGLARAQWFLAFTRWGAGTLTTAEDRLDRALTRFRSRDDRWYVAAAVLTHAQYALVRDDLHAARRDVGRSAELFGELGDRWGELQATALRATLAEIGGDHRTAHRMHHEALQTAEALALWTEVSAQRSGLGRIALLTGDLDAADEHHEQARQLARAQSNHGLEQFARFGLALTARRRGDLDRAEQLLQHWREGNLDWFDTLAPTAEMGFVAELRGDAGTALRLHADGYRSACAAGGPRAVALALEGLAGARALAGAYADAAELLGTAAAAREGAAAPLPAAERGDVDRITARAREGLGGPCFDAAFARGGARPPDGHLGATFLDA